MPRVYYLGRVLQEVVDNFNDASFAQHQFVVEWHQFVFHIHPKVGDQLDAIFEQSIEKFLRDTFLPNWGNLPLLCFQAKTCWRQ